MSAVLGLRGYLGDVVSRQRGKIPAFAATSSGTLIQKRPQFSQVVFRLVIAVGAPKQICGVIGGDDFDFVVVVESSAQPVDALLRLKERLGGVPIERADETRFDDLDLCDKVRIIPGKGQSSP